MSTWTVMYDAGSHEQDYEFKEVQAETDIDAATKAARMLVSKANWRNASEIEFYVFEGSKPTPILIEVERTVKVKPKVSK
jgi:hypothetical protein